jgi:hypothetical protein
VTRLELPTEIRRSLACTNIIENVMIRSAMNETSKGFRKLKAHKQLPHLRAALIALHERRQAIAFLPTKRKAA